MRALKHSSVAVSVYSTALYSHSIYLMYFLTGMFVCFVGCFFGYNSIMNGGEGIGQLDESMDLQVNIDDLTRLRMNLMCS